MDPNQFPLGLPNAAFTDTSGDKDSKAEQIDGYEVFKEILVSINVHMGFLYLGWLMQMAGNILGYNLLLFIVMSLGLGMLFWSIQRFFMGKGKKPKITWRLFNWGVGCVLSLLIHYIF